MDLDQFYALANLVREAREKDRDLFEKLEKARAEWKAANEELTERGKVFDSWIAEQKNKACAIDDTSGVNP